jgi:hypothetical protein
MLARLKLWRLDFLERRLDREGRKIARRAKKEKNHKLEQEWYGCAQWDYYDLRWTRREIVTRDLIRQASSLLLPTPSRSDKARWDDSGVNYGHDVTLTTEAMNELRAAIRQEKRARRETFESYVKTIGGLLTIGTGLVGALIGLLTIWKHK